MKKILAALIFCFANVNSAFFLDSDIEILKSIQGTYGIKHSTFKKFMSNCYDVKEVSDKFKIVINTCLNELYEDYENQTQDKKIACQFNKLQNGVFTFQTHAPNTFQNIKIISFYGFIPDLKLFENLITRSTMNLTKLETLAAIVKSEQERDILNRVKIKVTEKRDTLYQYLTEYINISNKILFQDPKIIQQLPRDFSISRIKELIKKLNPKEAANLLSFKAKSALMDIQEVLM